MFESCQMHCRGYADFIGYPLYLLAKTEVLQGYNYLIHNAILAHISQSEPTGKPTKIIQEGLLF